jgi:uncharacterized SAM-dependent methyltransferase
VAECRRRFPDQQLVVLWLGSSVGNLNPSEAVQFFRDMTAGAGSNIQVRAAIFHCRRLAEAEPAASC